MTVSGAQSFDILRSRRVKRLLALSVVGCSVTRTFSGPKRHGHLIEFKTNRHTSSDQAFTVVPSLPKISGEFTGLQMLYPFCPLMLVYHLPNLQIEIPKFFQPG